MTGRRVRCQARADHRLQKRQGRHRQCALRFRAHEGRSKMRFWGFLFLVSCTSICFSQEWPKQKPVQIVVGFAPGATTDTVARIAAQKLQEALGQTIVVENRPGAGGNVATGQVKRAAADGYTLLVTSVAYAVSPSLYANAGYDALKDFVAVALGPSTPNVITVNPAVPAKNLAELIELARKQPLSYALVRDRHHHPPEHGVPEDRGEGGHHALALPAGAGGRCRGRRPHADLQHLDAACGAAGEGGQGASDRGDERAALAGASRGAHGERAGLQRLRRPDLGRLLRAGGHAAGSGGAAERRAQQGLRRGRRAREARRARAGIASELQRRIRGLPARGGREVGQSGEGIRREGRLGPLSAWTGPLRVSIGKLVLLAF